MDNNVIKSLLKIISSKIKEFKRNYENNILEDPNKGTLLNIIYVLKSNPYSIINLNERELITYINDYLVKTNNIDIDEITSFFNKEYKLLIAIARGNSNGLQLYFDNNDELNINKLISYLELCVQQIDIQHNEGIKKYNTYKNEYSIYFKLYDKLRSSVELEYITEEEINIIIELIKDQDLNYYKEVIDYIYQYNRRTQINIDLQTRHLFDEEELEEKKKKYSLDEELLNDLFETYGFTIKGMPKDIYQAILDNCDSNKIEELFEYINSNDNYKFLKDYGKSTIITIDENGKKKEITKNAKLIRRQFVVLYQILRYSNKEILQYLDEHKKQVDLEDVILKVKGVVRHVTKRGNGEEPGPYTPQDDNDLYVSGVFEYYNSNSEELNKLSKEHGGVIDYLTLALDCEKYTYVLGSESNRFKRNIAILKEYNFPFGLYNTSRDERMPWMGALCLDSNLLLSRIDLLIENGIRNGNKDESYKYMIKYPSVLTYDSKLISAIISGSYEDNLEYLSNGKLKEKRREANNLPENYYSALLSRPSLESFRSGIPQKYKEIANNAFDINLDYQDEYLARLEPYKIDTDLSIKGLAYNIYGVIVSLPKVKRIWYAIKSNYDNDFDLNKLFAFAITYNSYYNDEEISILSTAINERKMN